MAHDIMSQFYTCLNFPLCERIQELTRIIDQAGSHKDLQALFPQLINNIFAPSLQNGWGIRQETYERNEFDMLLNFLEPHGPMFRLCYKLLTDPQLKYNLPLNVLPLQLQMTLERGRCPQFYADLLTMDSQALNIVALALNPFDYYIFNFALYLVNNNQNKNWDHRNSVYFDLACDYLMHFLPCNPNVPVSPNISYYTGKVPMVAPLQTANRPRSPSLLVISDLSGISNQHPSSQTQSRNEIWRSETVLQIFIDIWMSVEPFNSQNIQIYQRTYSTVSSSPERVRIVRALVKHIHAFSAKYNSDPSALSALRKYARQIMCSRAYHYVKHLVTTWPLDASFRLVMELWLSLIQPWRYTDNTINQSRYPRIQRNQEEGNAATLDESFTQFIAENFPAYTCIFQLVIPRFTRLDLSAYKNAVMLFRLGKVFSQPHLVPMLLNLERAITDNVSGSPDNSHNNSNFDLSYTYNGVALNKWVTIAKQAISELNMTATFDYDPVWSENKREYMLEFVKRICAAKHTAEKNLENYTAKLNQQNQGFWNSVKLWFMMGDSTEESMLLEEYKKVPNYLSSCVNYFIAIFGLNENMLLPFETELVEDTSEHSSFANSNNLTLSIAHKLRNKPNEIQYMGDPELKPIMSYENTILVRILYQISTRLNELYGEEFSRLWNRNDFWGYVAREVLQKPTTIHLYVKDSSYQQSVVNQELPARLSLRPLGSHVFVAWISIGYIIFRMSSYSGIFYLFFIITAWSLIVLSKASLKILRVINE
ncbi:sphingomyelin phosphodiesterase 4 [Maniola jurtina]|uniref:sphingomyelin phosphodiesterase 4 n=1 Tax=Maniola jurtina TaxID=191418 RepID=UPI001E68A924|nr:sphingomyelin phosphodiesterase 4 [Maniola jurtina]XP_045782857.1 sphingomyelin phosphodiesterase 4 [Maniola jurtina]XP_045782866.1 sphingomyelin phosphodiesterase 4 [Maniola jurtina]